MMQATLWSSESADALDETPATGVEAYEPAAKARVVRL
jgi:hypothetical protein